MNWRASRSRGYGPEVERKGKKPTGKRKYIYFKKEPKRNDDEEKKRKVSTHEDSNPTPAAYNTATSFKAFSMVLTPANAVQS